MVEHAARMVFARVHLVFPHGRIVVRFLNYEAYYFALKLNQTIREIKISKMRIQFVLFHI